jgi:hypothetical protein
MFFWKRKPHYGPPQPRIEVFVRHCLFSAASAHKKRPLGFSREACHHNLLNTLDSRANVTYFLDTAREGDHFIKNVPHIAICEGTEAGSFLRLLEYIERLDLHPDTIVYLLEDDYLHKEGWIDVLFEGFTLPVDYVTLYDHRDKYTGYPKLTSRLFVTESCHWRTTPSTTNTFATRFRTLKEDMAIHRKFSLNRKITADHDKFCCLERKGAMLVSSIPGWSTHAEPEFMSPFFKEATCLSQEH